MPVESIIYNKMRRKGFLLSTLLYLRDCIIFWLPIKKLPKIIRTILYGDISFIFFIHPRRPEDYYLGLPFISILRKLLGEQRILPLSCKMAPVFVNKVVGNKTNGAVVSSLILPETLISLKKDSIESAIKAIEFCNKITNSPCIVGLGAWWPIISKRGKLFQQKFKNHDVLVTNGHLGTLISIYLMIEKIAKISNLSLNSLKIIIFGAGKMGQNVINILQNKIGKISIVDINEAKLKKLMCAHNINKEIVKPFLLNGKFNLYNLLNEHHIGIFVTSNLETIIKKEDIPNYFVIIDDSRPEAISRKISGKAIILEGGLMKIKGLKTYYNFGFGIDENVFGCLAETYALAIDKKSKLKSSIGDINVDDFNKTMSFFINNEIGVGDFKTGETTVPDNKIANFIKKRNEIICKTGEY